MKLLCLYFGSTTSALEFIKTKKRLEFSFESEIFFVDLSIGQCVGSCTFLSAAHFDNSINQNIGQLVEE